MRTVAALAILLALTIGYFWKLTLSSEYTWLENPDQAFQVRPWLDYEARELHAGRLPFWDPYHWGGQSLIGQVQPGLANPLNWILFAMPLERGHIPLRVLDWYWVLIHWVAAAFCYWLCRDLGAGHAASILGACIFAFAGFIGHAATPQFLMSAIWLPLVFLFCARVFRGERPLASAALCGASLGAALLSGHHNVPVYTAVVLGVLWVWYLAARRRVLPVLVFGVVAALVGAMQILPAVEYGRRAVRWAGAPEALHWNDKVPYAVHDEYSLRAGSLPGMVLPRWPAHASPFVGVVALSLALSAVVLRRRSPEVRFLAVVGALGLLLALGSGTPLQPIVYRWVPMVDKARYPAMAIVLCEAAIAALAALGMEAARGGKRWLAPSGIGASAAAICALAAVFHRLPPGQPLWTMAGFVLVLGGLLYLPRAAPAIVALFLVEAATFPPSIQKLHQPGSYLDQIDSQADIAEFFRSQPGWFRFAKDEDVVPYNFGDYHGIEEFSGFLASMPENVYRMVGQPRAERVFGIRFWVARKPSREGQVEVFASRSGVNVYRNPPVDQPLWSVHRTPCPGPDRMSPDRMSPDRMSLVSRTSNAVSIDADFACPGMAVVGDPWYPGWRAWIDGKREPMQEFEGGVRAVPLQAGRHRIEFRYRPASVYWGAALTALGVALTVLVCAFGGSGSARPHRSSDNPIARP